MMMMIKSQRPMRQSYMFYVWWVQWWAFSMQLKRYNKVLSKAKESLQFLSILPWLCINKLVDSLGALIWFFKMCWCDMLRFWLYLVLMLLWLCAFFVQLPKIFLSKIDGWRKKEKRKKRKILGHVWLHDYQRPCFV